MEEAKLRGIPAIRLNTDSHVQLGYGRKQRHVQATMTDRTSAIGVEIADEKFRTKELLSRAGIPTPDGRIAISSGEAIQIANDLGYPVAVKPEVGNHGRGISARVSDDSELETAFASAVAICSNVIVEKTMTGFDFRMLVIDGKLVAAARREPAHIVGDGTSTVQQLIEQVNADPRRGIGHERVLTAITIDHMSKRLLAFQGRSLDRCHWPPGKSCI